MSFVSINDIPIQLRDRSVRLGVLRIGCEDGMDVRTVDEMSNL